MADKRITPEMSLVDAIRAVLGMGPLYQKKDTSIEPCGRYRTLEALSQRANPDCRTCEGAGYIAGAAADSDRQCVCVMKKSA